MSQDVQLQAEYRKIAEVLGNAATVIDQVASALADLIAAEQCAPPAAPGRAKSIAERAPDLQIAAVNDDGDVDRGKLRQLAVEQFEVRRLRQRHFARSMFGEPAWDILLALYIFDWSGGRFTSGTLSEHIGTPTSSVIRWLAYLDREGLTRRDDHPTDRRKSFIVLSNKGRAMLDRFLQDMGSLGPSG